MLENNDKNNEPSSCLSVLIDFIPDPVIVIDGSGKIVYANKTIGKFTGYTREELIGKNVSELDFISKEYKQLIAKNAKERLAGSNILPYEIRITCKNGEVKCLKVNGNPIINEGKSLDLAIFHDVTEENKIQNELRQGLIESEEKFHSITNSIKEPIIVVNEEAKVTYWNPAAEKTFDYTSEEAIGKDIHNLVVPNSMYQEGKERIAISVKTFTQTGIGYFTVGNVELVGRRKDGSEFPAELSISPTKLSGKWSVVGVVKNITDRKQAEQKLRDAEQRYHTLFNQAPLGVLIVDPETAAFVEFNDLAPLQLGYSREEFEKMTIYDIEALESPERTRSHIKEMVTEGKSEFETEHRTKNGEIKNIWVTTRAFPSAGKTFLHCVYRDITEIKKVQNALMENEARYRQLVELAQEGIWAINNDFITVFVNPRMAQMLGYAESEMIGKRLFDFLDKDMVEKIRSIMEEFKHRDMKGQYEYEFPRKDGTRINTSINISTITDDQGQITGALAVMADITKRKLAEKALRNSEELSRAIVVNAPIGIATSDASCHFVSANEAFCRILGYSEDELHKLTFKEITHPEDVYESIQKLDDTSSRKDNLCLQWKKDTSRKMAPQ